MQVMSPIFVPYLFVVTVAMLFGVLYWLRSHPDLILRCYYTVKGKDRDYITQQIDKLQTKRIR